jgi:hypothetical protein
MFYLRDAVESANLRPADDENGLSDDEEHYDKDFADFDSITSKESEVQSLSIGAMMRAVDDGPPEAPPAPPAFGIQFAAGPINFPPPLINAVIETNNASHPEDETPPIPRNKSIAHHDLKAKKVVWCSLDLETGGEYCGIIQLLAEIFRLNPVDPTHSDYIREPDIFNHYVRPPDSTYWNEEAVAGHMD